MIVQSMPARYCAVSIDVVADLDATYVKAHIRTDTGKTIALICEGTRIPAIQCRIESLQHAFPGLAARIPIETIASSHVGGPGLPEPAHSRGAFPLAAAPA